MICSISSSPPKSSRPHWKNGRAGIFLESTATGNTVTHNRLRNNNTNHLASCTTPGTCGDVSASVGYTNLVVPTGSNATVNFVVSSTAPSSGFYISQTDTTSGQSLFISNNVQITGNLNSAIASTPEPAPMALMGGGLGLLLGFVRRRQHYSYGPLSTARVREVREWASKYGFEPVAT